MIKFIKQLFCKHKYDRVACLKRTWCHEGLIAHILYRCDKCQHEYIDWTLNDLN